MNAELAERLEVLRRIGERGLRLAQTGVGTNEHHGHVEHLDLWQHLLDELARVNPAPITDHKGQPMTYWGGAKCFHEGCSVGKAAGSNYCDEHSPAHWERRRRP